MSANYVWTILPIKGPVLALTKMIISIYVKFLETL